MQKNRPLGVTIIAILAVIGGIGSLLSGFAIMAVLGRGRSDIHKNTE